MADQQVDILIKILADVKGGQLTRDEIEKVKAASAAAGKESVAASTKATEATNNWKASARGLALEYPILARVAAMALNPISIAVAAVAAATNRATEITRTWENQMQSSMAAAGKPISTLAQQFREMESERTKSNEAFQASLANIQTFADAAVTKFQAIRTAIDEALNAQEKFELAMEKDPAKQADLRFAFAARRSMNADAAEAAINQRREQQLGELDSEAAKQRDIFSGLARGRSREAIEAELRDGGAGLATRQADETKQVAELKAAVLDSHIVPGTFGKVSTLPDSLQEAVKTGSASEIQEARRLATSLLPGGNAQIEALVTTIQSLEKTTAAQKDFQSRRPGMEMAVAAHSAMNSAVTRRDTLEGEIVRSRDVSRSTEPFRTEAEIANAATAAVGRGQGGAARMALGAAAGADAVLAGGKANPEQAAMIQALTQMLGLQGQSQKTILEMFAKINDRHQNFDEALKTISSRIANNRRFE